MPNNTLVCRCVTVLLPLLGTDLIAIAYLIGAGTACVQNASAAVAATVAASLTVASMVLATAIWVLAPRKKSSSDTITTESEATAALTALFDAEIQALHALEFQEKARRQAAENLDAEAAEHRRLADACTAAARTKREEADRLKTRTNRLDNRNIGKPD
jgi:hypothetical protein